MLFIRGRIFGRLQIYALREAEQLQISLIFCRIAFQRYSPQTSALSIQRGEVRDPVIGEVDEYQSACHQILDRAEIADLIS